MTSSGGGVGNGDTERLTPYEHRPRPARDVDRGRDVVELRAAVAAQVVEADALTFVVTFGSGDDVQVVVGAGPDVEVLQADDLAAVEPAVDVDGSLRPVVDAPERRR